MPDTEVNKVNAWHRRALGPPACRRPSRDAPAAPMRPPIRRGRRSCGPFTNARVCAGWDSRSLDRNSRPTTRDPSGRRAALAASTALEETTNGDPRARNRGSRRAPRRRQRMRAIRRAWPEYRRAALSWCCTKNLPSIDDAAHPVRVAGVTSAGIPHPGMASAREVTERPARASPWLPATSLAGAGPGPATGVHRAQVVAAGIPQPQPLGLESLFEERIGDNP